MPLHADHDKTNPWQPNDSCPRCGSKNLKIGCQYADCGTCYDIEVSECKDCNLFFGGSAYWKTPTKFAVGLAGQIGEVSFRELLEGRESR